MHFTNCRFYIWYILCWTFKRTPGACTGMWYWKNTLLKYYIRFPSAHTIVFVAFWQMAPKANKPNPWVQLMSCESFLGQILPLEQPKMGRARGQDLDQRIQDMTVECRLKYANIFVNKRKPWGKWTGEGLSYMLYWQLQNSCSWVWCCYMHSHSQLIITIKFSSRPTIIEWAHNYSSEQ